jgi:hypothetical protein
MRKTVLLLAIAMMAALMTLGHVIASSNETFSVTPVTPLGWTWEDDNGAVDAAHGFVDGPGTPPAGTGSYRIALNSTAQGTILYNSIYQGTKFSDITSLEYWTYQTTNTDVQAISLQFTADNDLTDADNSFKGRLVFEPYQGQPAGTVQTGVWQKWNPMNGVWWGTGSNPLTRPFSAACPQSNPCTWAQVISLFPNGGIHKLDPHAIIFKAGSGWANFDGNVDKFTIGINDGNGGEDVATYDFNLHSTPATADDCKNGGWKSFNPPSGPYKNQGQCVSFVAAGK